MTKTKKILYSPSQITTFLDSPFAAWMDRFAWEHRDQAPAKDPEDELMASLAEKGYAHEEALEAKFAQQGLSVEKIQETDRDAHAKATIAAMKAGVDIICQGRLTLKEFHGYSDFLVKVKGESLLGDYHYEIWDTKLSSTVKPSFLIQLSCYAEMITPIQGRMPEWLTVALGDGSEARFRSRDYAYYYQEVKRAFLAFHRDFDPSQKPDPADSASWGNWSEHAEQILLARDHLFQIAGIKRGQIAKLNAAGIATMTALAESTKEGVKGISGGTLAKLKAQARIQNATKSVHARQADAPPAYEVIRPESGSKMGLALLPPHSPKDVFFDIEGFPLDKGGLEYLWGATYFDDSGTRQFIDFWAHDREQEKAAFKGFIDWAYSRWQQDPTMHIYHYASYEITACRKLMGRYGVCEHEVDQLLRNEVFVDLYKVVKGGILLGEPKYSIKNVEHLYRGKRDTAVGTGGDSVVVYEQWRQLCAAGEQGDTWQSSSILSDIRDYNIDDCNSTQELVAWLRAEQAKQGIAFIGQQEVVEPELTEEVTALTQLRDALLKKAATQPEEQGQLSANLAWLLEFHRRENKPMFWRLFERLGLSPDELVDDLDCLANCVRTEREPYKPTPRSSLAYEYSFDPSQEFKGSAKAFYLLNEETAEGKRLKATVVKEDSALAAGRIVLKSTSPLPCEVTLIPDEYVNPRSIPTAINASVEEYHAGTLGQSQPAIIDFLTRAKPRFKGRSDQPKAGAQDQGEAIVTSSEPSERLQQVIAACRDLDSSYLTIQGPPGAGKTYTGKHVISALLKDGAKVGIASNSHKAINNLLLSTAKHCAAEGIEALFACTKDTDPMLEELGVKVVSNNKLSANLQPSCVLGSTAWGFTRDDLAGTLDYLFVDEAGQVSVANLVGMARSARNLVLLGDQMQLGQPLQGTHPADSGLSVLDYLLKDKATIESAMGVFLGTTYRMHSQVNDFISQQVYDGKLKAEARNDARIIEVPSHYPKDGPLNLPAGIRFVPVEHQGNSQASDEEVAVIKALAEELLGRTFHQDATTTRPITWQDMLFVAPYNHQVTKLKAALGDQAKVGSVDKFQGQEAPIVFLSMCASDPAESPRGLDFLFDRNRLNVAISRAQSLAIVVANPAIGRVPVTRVEQMKLINMFNGLVIEGQQPAP